MSGRAIILTILALALAGCALVTPARSPATWSSSTAPVVVASRTLLPSCGVENATRQDGPWNEPGRTCFWGAYQAQRQAEFATTRLSIEGDPITSIYRILGAGRVEVFIDQTQDHWSAGGWLRLDCSALVAIDSTAPTPDFGPGDSCVEATLR
jgi:hypothetical protein